MANRFPLIVDSSGTAAIKELASGDNLDLTGNGIVGAGTVALTNLTVGGSQGSDGQVLTSTGSGIAWEDAASGGGGGSGGGMWTQIATTTISSEVFSVEFTSLGNYTEWEVRMTGLIGGTDSQTLSVVFDYGSGYVTNNPNSPDGTYRYKRRGFGDQNANYAGEKNEVRNHIPISNVALNRPSTSHGFGKVNFTSTGSRMTAEMNINYSNDTTGLNHYVVIADNTANYQGTISKIKFIMTGNYSVDFPTSSTKGMTSGIFTLYGR